MGPTHAPASHVCMKPQPVSGRWGFAQSGSGAPQSQSQVPEVEPWANFFGAQVHAAGTSKMGPAQVPSFAQVCPRPHLERSVEGAGRSQSGSGPPQLQLQTGFLPPMP